MKRVLRRRGDRSVALFLCPQKTSAKHKETLCTPAMNTGTEDIFDGSVSRAARKCCPKSIWPVARRKLDQINRIREIGELRIPPGNRLERLKGDRDDQYSIRINQQYSPVGVVRSSTPLLIEARNVLTTGDRIEYLGRKLEPIHCTAVAMQTVNGEPKERANPGDEIILTTSPPLEAPEINAVLRKRLDQKT